jgi:hypothetical protein
MRKPVPPTLSSVEAQPSLSTPPPSAATNKSLTLLDLSLKMQARARRETDDARRQRFLTFAHLLIQVNMHAKNTELNAEKAYKAANEAQYDHKRTQEAAAHIQRLAAILAGPSRCH